MPRSDSKFPLETSPLPRETHQWPKKQVLFKTTFEQKYECGPRQNTPCCVDSKENQKENHPYKEPTKQRTKAAAHEADVCIVVHAENLRVVFASQKQFCEHPQLEAALG